MKRTVFQFALGLSALATAQATEPPKPDPMASFYGNTVTIAVPDGYYYAKRFVDPDGTWREPRGSNWIRGVWKLEGGQVCSWQTEPAVQNPRRYCYAPVRREIGEEWTTTDPDTGNLVIQRLEPGRN